MASQKTKSARTIAIAALNRFDTTKGRKHDYINQILNQLITQTTEKQRATDLVFGCIRNRSAIDMVITQLTDCPIERIPPKLLNVIRTGAYELIYSPATAEHAIVNEAVENAKTIGNKKQAGFVNALLRQILRHITNRQTPLSNTNTQTTLPQTTSTGCQFDSAILPDPAASPADYFSTAFSLPKWLIADWLTEFGFEKTKQICFASNRKTSIYLRPNTLKTTAHQLIEKLRTANIKFDILPDISMIKTKSPKAVTQLPGFAEGLFTIQDPTASLPVKLLEPKPSQTILDLCAAPGTKTTQLAEATNDNANIIATDIDSKRLKKVKENIDRLGISTVKIITYESIKKTATQIGPFDCILLDVPCSNSAVLSKRPEVRLRIKPNTIKKLTKTQNQLLQFAATIIKTKGRIAYSTCSIQKEENSQLIKNFLTKNTQLKLEAEQLTLPSAKTPDHDGGYVAILTTK